MLEEISAKQGLPAEAVAIAPAPLKAGVSFQKGGRLSV